MYILAAGGVLVAALIVWALTRTVEPASVMSTETIPVADASTAAPTSTTQTSGFTTTATTTPVPTGTAPTATPNVQVSTQTPQAPPPVEGNKAEVKRIAVEDLRAQHNRGDVTVIDVRDAASFAAGHIPGALNMPFASIQGMTDSIPKGKPVVTYCT